MVVILLVVHVFVIVALVGVVLMQKSEGGALGIGGGMSGFMTGRSTANLLTRATAILAALFMATSVSLVILSNQHRSARSILDSGAKTEPALPAAPRPALPAVPHPTLPALPPVNPAPPAPAAPGAPPAR